LTGASPSVQVKLKVGMLAGSMLIIGVVGEDRMLDEAKSGSSGNIMLGTQGSSGRQMVGTGGIELSLTEISGMLMDGKGGIGLRDSVSLAKSFGLTAAEWISSSTTSRGLLSKLTIGLPGLSLTIVGRGRFGLLSLRCLLVAARMSSPLISMPSLVGVSFDGTS